MAVVAEVSKGAVPPRNPFLRGEPLHYYWLPHLLPAVEYRMLERSVSLEQVLLVNSIALGLAFVLFLYGFVRQWVEQSRRRRAGDIGALVFTSFEGLERMLVLWVRGESLQSMFLNLKDLNIDAVTRWFYGSLPVDGLQRLLWYQPHHSTGYALGLSACLILAQARDGVTSAPAGVLRRPARHHPAVQYVCRHHADDDGRADRGSSSDSGARVAAARGGRDRRGGAARRSPSGSPWRSGTWTRRGRRSHASS